MQLPELSSKGAFPMTQVSRISRRLAAFGCVAALASLASPAAAQPAGFVIGSANVATADPAVPRPSTTPCAVQLYSGFTFADFSPKPFSYTPPAACPGPWAKVVLEADFAVTTGRQFDRTAQIALGHVNLYYGTTAEPSSTLAPSWHVERDLTDYTALFRTAQTGEVNLGNLVNSTYTGILSGSARLLFYPAAAAAPAPRTADVVLSLSTAPGGAALLDTTANVLAPSLALPTNIEGAYLDVITQSQSSDEFWFTCVPDDVADDLFSCPGSSFREAEITIDGQPAGVAPVYPWLFTGAVDPLLWRPIPAVQTLNFEPYRVDLTPFAGVLSNGQPHQVGLSVFNANHYFLVTGTLLLYLDAGSTQVTGAVTRNTLTAQPQYSAQKTLTPAADGSLTANVETTSTRQLQIAGFVNTSHGRVETTVLQALHFSNDQDFVLSDTRFFQDIDQNTTISSSTLTREGHTVRHVEKQLSYPLTFTIDFVVNADGSQAQTTTVDQKFESLRVQGGPGALALSQILNHMSGHDTLLFNAAGAFTGFRDRATSQTYLSRETPGTCYSRKVTSADGLLTSVVDGQGCPGHGH
jgi:hypothetical protein